jgi:arylsulfatase A-like enzyme
MTGLSLSSYKTPIAKHIFKGVFFTTLCFMLIEIFYLVQGATQNISPQSKWLSLLYAAAPIALLGISIASFLELLFMFYFWGKKGIHQNQVDRWSMWSALPIAILTLSLGLGFTLSFYTSTDVVNRSLTAYFWLLPSGAATLYLWHVTRVLFSWIDRKYNSPISLLISITLVGLILVLFYLFLNDIIKEKIFTWPLLAIILTPCLFALGVAISWFSPQSLKIDQSIRRIGFILALGGCVGLLDLSEQMNRIPVVKKILLDQTLLTQVLIRGIQPFYDRDGDGVAGRMGGQDCDDSNPSIYPGAVDIPLNGIDEDCHGGDRLPPPNKKILAHNNTSSISNFKTQQRPNIVLITIDTLRADHLHYHGYQRKTSPFLDRLSLQGLNFQWAFSTGAQTRTSMPAVFIGRYYSEVARSKGDWATVYPDNLTLAERLRSEKYYTVGIPSHNYFNPNYGLNQGFTEWNFNVVDHFRKGENGEKQGSSYHKTGAMVTKEAIKWLDQRSKDTQKKPFFMWLHYFDPHNIYKNHADINFGERPIDLYDEEIQYTDLQIEKLFRAFEDSQSFKNTYFIIHSDHGEGFGERGYQYHGQSLYNDQVHVPLLMVGPQLPARRIMVPVSLIDLMPTILELAGVEALAPEPRGDSLLKFVHNTQAEHVPIFSEMLRDSTHKERRMIVDWPWKLHYSFEYNRYMLFNLQKDPFEEIDKRDDNIRVFKRLQKRLFRFLSEETVPLKPYNR